MLQGKVILILHLTEKKEKNNKKITIDYISENFCYWICPDILKIIARGDNY